MCSLSFLRPILEWSDSNSITGEESCWGRGRGRGGGGDGGGGGGGGVQSFWLKDIGLEAYGAEVLGMLAVEEGKLNSISSEMSPVDDILVMRVPSESWGWVFLGGGFWGDFRSLMMSSL